MFTVNAGSGQAPPQWDVRADERFVKQYRKARRNSGGDFQNNIDSTIEDVCSSPLTGERKYGRLTGLRSNHIEQLVLLWEVTPDIAFREYAEKVEDVYLVGLVHHDDYSRSFVNRKPAIPYRSFVTVLRGDGVADSHVVYDTDGIEVEHEEWFTRKDMEGLILRGTHQMGATERLAERLPAKTGLSTSVRVAKGVDIGITVRRIIDSPSERIQGKQRPIA